MRSTWLCSRNDVVANLGVLVAAIGVRALQSGWPDLLVGSAIATLFLASAARVIRQAIREFHTVHA
jgi:Co/Zn/Cd efflux system component